MKRQLSAVETSFVRSARLLAWLVGATALIGLERRAEAKPEYVPNVPNVDCPSCHVNVNNSPTQMTLFGSQVKAIKGTAGSTWWANLCPKNADGDAQTNGAELGDPCCTWVKGAVPQYTSGLGNPSSSASLSSNPACAAGCATNADCDDGNACNGAETCSGGSCAAGISPNCNDANACTTDACVPATGCTHTAVSCNDSNPCTTDTCSAATGCAHAPVVCNDSNACTTDNCNPASGCTYTALSCDDGDACTTDKCTPATGCSNVNTCQCMVDSDCNDGNLCNGVEKCVSGACVNGTALACDDGSACTTDTCNAMAGCAHAPVVCDDGDACTTDSCDPAGGCAHAALSCNDGDSCTTDSCDPAIGCSHDYTCQCTTDDQCDDQNICNGAETCASGACVPGTDLACDDGDACTNDSCDPAAGCTHPPVSCEDTDGCTSDACDPATGCTFTPLSCDDGVNCTVDTCVSETGCSNMSTCPCTIDAECDDGNPCNGAETCQVGSCTSGAAVDCDDADPCTADLCDAAVGCHHLYDSASCEGAEGTHAPSVSTHSSCAVRSTDGAPDGSLRWLFAWVTYGAVSAARRRRSRAS